MADVMVETQMHCIGGVDTGQTLWQISDGMKKIDLG
jgi:hypothetical protein